MTAHRQVWSAIQSGQIALAVELARGLLPVRTDGLPEDWPIYSAYAIACSQDADSDRGLAVMAGILALPRDRARGLRTMIGLKNAIKLGDWYTATRMCARIRAAMGVRVVSPYSVFYFLVADPDQATGDGQAVDRYFSKLDSLIAQ